jgi:protein-S-isoprenylcysteine O-methyltransferase Ste14
MSAKLWIAIGLEAAVFAALLFGAAGTLYWPAGWAFLVIFFASALLMSLMLARHDPALLEERLKPIVQKDQPIWDRIIMSAMVVFFIVWLVLMGLDAVRFHWSRVPVWVQVLGGAGVVLSLWICSLAFRENTFAVPVVKIQEGRGQKVISTGPYAVVRHPLYSGALLLFPSTALLLGSWWGLAFSTVLAAGLALRTAMEDRELQRGLEGYRDYANRVRYRLVPLVW